MRLALAAHMMKDLGGSSGGGTGGFINSVVHSMNDYIDAWDSNAPLDVSSWGLAAGDLVVMSLTFDSNADSNPYPVFGTKAFDVPQDYRDESSPGCFFAYRFLDGTENNDSIWFENTSADWQYWSCVVAAFSGYSSYVGSISRTSSNYSTAPPFYFGTVTGNFNLVIASGNLDDDQVYTWDEQTDYTFINSTTTNYSTTVMSYRAITGTSETPSSLSGDFNDAWRTFTVAFA